MKSISLALIALTSASLIASTSAVLADCAQPALMAYQEGVRTQKFVLIGQETRKDPVDLFACAAEKETDPRLQGKYYNALGEALKRRGKFKDANIAYESAALLGNESAGNEIYKAHRKGVYSPHALSQIASIVYVPRAQGEKNAGAAMLLANLVGSGQLTSQKFQTSSYWLQKAVDGGSIPATRLLAEDLARNGNVQKAAYYYKLIDKQPPSNRALREARSNFLGKGKPTNTKLGLAWLQYAQALAPADSAKLAAKFFRVTGGEVYPDELKGIAAAGGIPDLQLGSGSGSRSAILAAYSAAMSDENKRIVLSSLIEKANAGDGMAAYDLARILDTDGGFAEFKPAAYYVSALENGNLSSLKNIANLVAVLDQADPLTTRVLAALVKVGQAGNPDAQKALGALYIVGGPVPLDYDMGVDWLRKASDGGDSEAKYRLGVLLIQNAKDESDRNSGRGYLESAAAKNNEAAKKFLVELMKASP